MDDGCCVFLVLLDLSAAFDTVDHSTMISRLHHSFGVSGDVLRWFKSYLKDRYQVVSIHGTVSSSRTLDYGVPQGSVLGPELFKDYITPLPDLINSFHVGFHGYADDTQLYVAFEPGKNETESRKK
jgi:retron-type reverse transcriptase